MSKNKWYTEKDLEDTVILSDAATLTLNKNDLKLWFVLRKAASSYK